MAGGTAAFLTGEGDMVALMRSHDWTGSPLGAPEDWPAPLRTVVSLMLGSKFPMFAAWGPELGFLYNDAYVDILGDKHPRALGRAFHDIWAEIWDDLLPSIELAMAGEASYHENLLLTMCRKGYDEDTWFTFSYSPLRDEAGGVRGMFCACVETTEQVLAARHRAEEVERMRQLFQQAPGAIVVLRGPEHVYEIANDAYQRLVGRTALVGRALAEALPEVRGQGFIELLDRVYDSGEAHVGHAMPITLRRGADGALEERYVDFIFQPTRDHRGAVSGIFVEGSDVTDAVLAARAVAESEEGLRQLANAVPQMAWMATADGTVDWVNERWVHYTGMGLDVAREQGWQQHFHPDDLPSMLESWRGSLASGQRYEARARIRAANGEYRGFLITAAPLRDAEGRIVRWFGTNTDVTPIEKAQQELRDAGRRKDEFLAMLAHELRNPLAPIATAAELLRLGVLDPARVQQTSGVIARQVDHMTKLVDDLLDVSRVTRGLITLRREPLDFSAVVAEAVEQAETLMNAKGHRLTVELPDDAGWVLGDRTRLIQVLSNLLNNAARYTPARGTIAVRVTSDAGQVCASVEDSGIGIAAPLLPHVFELFTQAERSSDRSQGGLGLGLALVKSLVELQGGTVDVRSEGQGLGSRFTVRLPRIGMPLFAPATAADAQAVHGTAGRHMMVVDDNLDAARMLALLLESSGHSAEVCTDGFMALEAVVHSAPSALFLDIGLPGMDGYELVRRLRALPETSHACIVAVTGYGTPEDRARALAAGFDEHLVKPVQPKALYTILARLAGEKSM
ncbi:PAS domain S-box-containing protein [Pseudoduganella lurida]|uniref:histidine kinase n=1 Tax=Pseudoduganella lurida TaxID=1036180 RepID=A0A562RAN1_9BURK|nr:PAS domain-containing protein [Pseudoduganella lurida]TWI66139.1 PAS domain S-box-containing protein [Pseudoduganella lurida]